MVVSRRSFLAGSAAAVTGGLAAACSSVHSVGVAGAPVRSTATPGAKASGGTVRGAGKGSITFAVWGGSASEEAAFGDVVARFEAANPGARVHLQVVPYDGFFAGLDRSFRAGTAPDVFRVDYTTIGKYASAGVLLDMTPYFTTAETREFLPALWGAIEHDGVPYGVPHQTDTTCVVYNRAALRTAGVSSVPDRLDDAWSWEEFSSVAAKLRASLPASKSPFAYDWTQAGAPRWLSWLYQAGGTLLSADQREVALPSAAATKALDYTTSFFTRRWVPATNTIKTSTYSDNFFLSQTVPMTFVGDFLVPELADRKQGYSGGDWAATFLPRERAAASDLGGNAVVARADGDHTDLAAAFCKYLVTEDAMRRFCQRAVELPTLRSLAGEALDYAYRPDVVAVCAQQATTISDRIVAESTVGAFASINTVLQDQLELAFHGQSSAKTIAAIASGVKTALG